MDIVKVSFQAANEWGISPSEFWQMSIEEWWLVFDWHREKNGAAPSGAGGVSAADWERARRKHAEKKKNGGSS